MPGSAGNEIGTHHSQPTDRNGCNFQRGTGKMIASRWPRGVIACALVAGCLIALAKDAETQVESAKASKSARIAKNRVAIQVSQNDKAQMDLALNNAANIIEYYRNKGETVVIEIVTYGPGLHMLRADTSPVKDRIAPMALENPNLTFIACGNTQINQSKAEGKP